MNLSSGIIEAFTSGRWHQSTVRKQYQKDTTRYDKPLAKTCSLLRGYDGNYQYVGNCFSVQRRAAIARTVLSRSLHAMMFVLI